MKPIFFILALPIAFSTLPTEANARDQNGNSSRTTASPTPASATGENQYALDMARRVHDELALYGSNQRIRSQIKKVDQEIFHVTRETSGHNYDRSQVRAEVARIDDELHTIDLELRDLSVHEPMSLTGGKLSPAR